MRQCPLCARQYDDTADFCPQDGRVLLLPDPLLGRVVDGKYRIDALLGGGGQSTVYRATHVHLQRTAAFKVVRGDFAGQPTSDERFKREALAVARLKHPNIVTVHDFGIDDRAGAYLVLEFLEGRSLRQELLHRSRMPLDETVAVMRQICSAVQAAHDAGIVHRDIKPDNIFIEMRSDGVRAVKILDFGVAKLRGDADGEPDVEVPSLSDVTATGGSTGTPAYMSPEQCEGATLDTRTDIYSVGCVLYEMLTGRPPFVFDGETLLYKHIHETPRPPSSVVGGLPPELDAVVLRALAKDRAERFQSADELMRALEAVPLPGAAARDEAAALTTTLERSAAALRTAERDARPPNNLPQQVTTFVGRDEAIAGTVADLATARLVTITGPGGSGKTRLSIEVAARVLDEFPDGVWQIQLAPLADPSLVPQAVASVLDVHEEPGRTLGSALLDFLHGKRLLLLLDNCEHLVAACAELVDSILRSCPRVRVLATSQEPLGILGESTHLLPSLSLPDPESQLGADEIADFEAVRLFTDRAKLSSPAFQLTDANAAAVARICARLDGSPLALELAAARIKLLSVDQIDARLNDRFRLLTGGNRTAEPRQRTLQAAIDWSYDLLDRQARRVLMRLSVFAGGFSLEAAEEVCSGAGVESFDVLYLLSNLVDKSLVFAEERGPVTRYRMLQTIRQYGGEKLRLSGEAAAVRTRHRDHFLALAERAERELKGPEQVVWLDRLEQEHDNLRAALEWCKTDAGKSDAYLRLTGALWEFWLVRGHERSGRAWLESAAAASDPSFARARAKALTGAGTLARVQGDYGRAKELIEESLRLWRTIGDKAGVAGALNHLGIVAHWRGYYDLATRLHEESLAISRETKDRWDEALALKNLGIVARFRSDYPKAVALFEESLAISRSLDDTWEIASTLNNLGVVVASRGEFARARELFEENLQLNRRLGEKRGVAMALNNLGEVAQLQGDYEQAGEFLVESLMLNVEAGDKRLIAYALECFVSLSTARSQPERALRLAGAASELRRAIDSPLAPAELEDFERAVERAREALGTGRADQVLADGRAMTLEQAVDCALESAV